LIQIFLYAAVKEIPTPKYVHFIAG